MSYSYEDRKPVRFEDLIGLTFIYATGEVGGEQIEFKTDTGRIFVMHHDQDCCENVYIESVVGDLQDLVGSPITLAEEVDSSDAKQLGEWDESFTWTFYKFATVKGYVDIRWYGTSNGYYSESVSFFEFVPG